MDMGQLLWLPKSLANNPQPFLDIGNLSFRQIWTRHQKLESQSTLSQPPPPPPPPHWTQGLWILGKFGLRIKSWEVSLPPPPRGHRE